MIKSLVRTTIFAGAAYGIYSIAKQLFPSQVDSAVKSAKSYGNDAVKSLTEQGKQLISQGKDMAHDAKSDMKNTSRRAV